MPAISGNRILSSRLRLLLPAVVAGVLLTSINPVGHASLPSLGDPTLDSFSSKQERQLGLAFYRSLRANLTFIDDLQINYYLNSLGQRLASHSDAAGNEFHFFMIKAPTINAFAGPSAYIGVHSRLFLEANNESEFASVLAHEIAHVSQRHLARAFDNAGQSTALTIATLLTAILVGTQDSQAGQAVLMSGIAGNQQSSINFTRSNEYEADRIGIGILSSTGINPQGMVDFFEILLDKSPDNGIEYLRTHPLNTNRVAEAKNRLGSDSEKLPIDSEDFQFARARLSVLLGNQPDGSADVEVTGKGTIGKYKQAIAAIHSNKAEEAIRILSPQVETNTHPWLRLALAEAYSSIQEDKKALEVLASLAALYPGYLPVTIAYVNALNNNKMPEKSIPILKKQLQTDDYAVIHKALANAYFANGQISAALESTGNQYARQGYVELAIQQYDNALQQEGISQSSKQRLQEAKKELKKIMQQNID